MTSRKKTSSRLSVIFEVPPDQAEQAATAELLSKVGLQLKLALTAYAFDRQWPRADFVLKGIKSARSSWSYRAELRGSRLLSGELQPGKLLAIGESRALAGLLGLETVDPFMDLPAKWIAATQEARARTLPLDGLFDQASLVVAHTLHAISGRWSESFGLNQALDWLADVSPAHKLILSREVTPRQGLFLELLKELVSDGLWLPPAEEFLEIFSAALAKADDDPWMLGELLRLHVVPRNLAQWEDHQATLWAVEWLARESEEIELSDRLVRRLECALARAPRNDISPLLITDIGNRRGLSRALRHAFSDLPVMSWQELEGISNLQLFASVDTTMEFDPSPWPGQLFEVYRTQKNFED